MILKIVVDEENLTPFLNKFKDVEGVEIVSREDTGIHGDIIICPGNSFGIMDGGFDQAVSAKYGHWVQDWVQEKIKQDFGILPVGVGVLVKPNMCPWICYAPTMIIPGKIPPVNAYLALYGALYAIRLQGMIFHYDKTTYCPSFGTGYGQLTAEESADAMFRAIHDVRNGYDIGEIKKWAF